MTKHRLTAAGAKPIIHAKANAIALKATFTDEYFRIDNVSCFIVFPLSRLFDLRFHFWWDRRTKPKKPHRSESES
jgi:hypothetical protein